jgi:hypothetical protein
MKTVRSSKMSPDLYQATRRYISEVFTVVAMRALDSFVSFLKAGDCKRITCFGVDYNKGDRAAELKWDLILKKQEFVQLS